MKLYLNDDTASGKLVLLRNAGHDVLIPMDVGMRSSKDPVHLRGPVDAGRILVSKNYKDFEDLHELIMACHGHHPGILVIRKDNNTKKDLKPGGIVRAIGKLEAASFVMTDQYEALNKWQ